VLCDDRDKEALASMVRLIASGQAIGVVGAGASASLGYPSWKRLREILIDDATKRGVAFPRYGERELTPEHLTQMPYLLAFKFLKEGFVKKGLGATYFELLKRTFGPPATGDYHRLQLLARLPVSHFITTNYDTALEIAHQQNGIDFTAINGYGPDLQDFIANVNADGYARRIFHAHGRYDQPEELVLTEDDYARIYSHQRLAEELWHLAGTRRFVFWGFSLDDLDVMEGFKQAKRLLNFGIRHFALLDLEDMNKYLLRVAELQNIYGIDPILYIREGNDFGGYTEALELLAVDVKNATAAVVEPEPRAELAEDVDAASRDAARLDEITSENLARRGVGEG
jgi:SIR2-like protein